SLSPIARETRPEEPATPASLYVLLAVGSLFVLTGALWLVVKGWDFMGETGRFGLLALLTGAIGAGGPYLEKRGHERTGFSLVVLFSQLLWADGAYLLVLTNAQDSAGPWALVSALVAGTSFGLGVSRRSVLLSVLAALGAVMALVLTWSALPPSGRLALLAAATGGIAISAFALDRREHGAAVLLHALCGPSSRERSRESRSASPSRGARSASRCSVR
ncbi:DUF2157 domain-containing protein, partial [bacterium]|nr:DUF2157 domain-containing protein [bacterium]